jgi:hypothetical protein
VRALWLAISVIPLVALCDGGGPPVESRFHSNPPAYLGFDRNEYPGDANLFALRRIFAFAGYWLNSPPGTTVNTWAGHHKAIETAGFGFLLLFNGRLDSELKKAPDAAALGRSDAAETTASAHREGFPGYAIIFLDLEEGGRMLSEQRAYVHAWVDGVNASGFHAGIYCSGIPAPAGPGISVITADDIRQNANGRKIVFWVVNDACPPSPGCAFPKRAPAPSRSGVAFAEVWQFAQSPKRRDVAGGCAATYAADGSCYAPGAKPEVHLFVDVNTANSDDPSKGRSRSR